MRTLIGSDLGSYTFNASAKTVTLVGIPETLTLDQIGMIVHQPTGAVLFHFAEETNRATISSNVITLTASTTGMSDTDELMILCDIERGNVNQVVPFTTSAESLHIWDFSGVKTSDAVVMDTYSNGRSAMCMISDPATEQSSVALFKRTFGSPHKVEAELSMSRRGGIYGCMDVFADDAGGPDAETPAIAIATIQQTTTTLTITLASPFIGYIGDWISIYGVPDTRVCYNNFVVATISADGLTLAGTVYDNATIPSLSAGPYATGYIQRDDQLSGSQNGYRLRFEGPTAATASFLSRQAGGTMQKSGTLVGAQTVTAATTAPVFTSYANGSGEVRATSRYTVLSEPDTLCYADRAVDLSIVAMATRAIRTDAKPSWQKSMSLRFRIDHPISAPRVVAKIVSAVKSGSTTATITTAAAHGLVNGNYVGIAGVRDQTNFANTTNVVATVTGPTTFTCVIPTSATATSYGGCVSLITAQTALPGLIAQAGSTVTRQAGTGFLWLVGSATWVGATVGEFVFLCGCRDSSGADLLVDGLYKVVSAVTSTVVLSPVYDYAGTLRVASGGGTGASAISTTNCGGTLILATTLRVHALNVEEHTQQQVQIFGQGTDRQDIAMPVRVVVAATTSVTQGAATALATASGTGAWFTRPGIHLVTDVASGTILLASSPIAFASTINDYGNAYQIVIPVTATSGTNPTMDVVVQESDDGGTNWFDVYHFQRITANGCYRSPILRCSGRHIRTYTRACPKRGRTSNGAG